MPIPIFQVDSFTQKPFQGNPAGVCLIDSPRPDEWMQNVAREMALSETAFPLPAGDGYHLRWFTPAAEVALCGHATLATAHILWEQGLLAADRPAVFETRSGRLTCTLGPDGWISMDFPAQPAQEFDPPADLLPALGLKSARFLGGNERDYLVEVEDEDIVRALSPDFPRLAALPKPAVIVTAPSRSAQYDFVSRFFAPALGVPEDPVTGSAHCALAPYWGGKLGKTNMSAFQASRRGGELLVRLEGERVVLQGQAVTILRGTLAS